MRTMHLFAGVGGGLLSDLILGHTPVVAVEWEPYACQVLRERATDGWFPNLRVWEGDVRLFDPSEYAERVDCIHAGFPCQDISVAGKQAGVAEGTRSGLYREVLRIARTVRPRYIFLENVAAITSKGLDQVVKDVAEMGYDMRWCCLRASDVGAPHHRDRWWCLATDTRHKQSSGWKESSQGLQPDGWGEAWSESASLCSVLSDTNSIQRRTGGVGQDAGANGRDNATGICADVADTRLPRIRERRPSSDACESMQFGSGVSSDGVSRRCKQEGEVLADTTSNESRESPEWEGWKDSGRRSDDPRRIESARSKDVADAGSARRERFWNGPIGRNQEHPKSSVPSWWEVESNVGRVVDGIPNRVHRLKGLGNAQVPLQAAVAFKILSKGWID